MGLVICLALLWLCLLAGPAAAADPIMPLEQVQRGMQCEGRSVFRGTAIETFDVEILDVVQQSNTGSTPSILFRASGPAVGQGGLGFGFSGSPIYCPDGDGVMRNAGAVFAGVEDYGNDVALATPIEAILSMPVTAPAETRPATAAERRATPWTGPLTVSGVGPRTRRALWSAAADQGLLLINAPATSAQVGGGADLRPGASVAAGLSTGAVGLNAIGTVAYRDDAGRVWAFGHPLDSAGQRSLVMQGAFVHTVIENPNPPAFSLGTYKLASASESVGTVDFDGNFAISGTLGALPATIPVVVRANGPAGDLPKSISFVADESPLNHPSGLAALSLVTSIAVSDGVLGALGSSGARSYGRMCVRADVEEREEPMRFCNRYVGDGQFVGGIEIAMGGDASTAATFLERFDHSQIHVERVRATLDVHEGMRFARLRAATAPRRVRPGERIPVEIEYQLPREEMQTSTFRVRVPRSVRPGRRTLTLRGTGADPGNESLDALFSVGLSPDDAVFFFGNPPPAPSTVEGLARAISGIHRFDGISAQFGRPRQRAARRVFRHDELRIGGSKRIELRVLRR